MLTIYIDADACPVKDEVYKVARRYAMKTFVVANSTMRVPAGMDRNADGERLNAVSRVFAASRAPSARASSSARSPLHAHG